MIFKGTRLIPLDKNGVWLVNTFHLYGGFLKKFSSIGNFIKISVRILKNNLWTFKKAKLKSIIIWSKYFSKKNDGTYIKYKYNNCVLLKKRLYPLGKEIYGPGNYLLYRKKFLYSFSGII